jgi:hypothetical protein
VRENFFFRFFFFGPENLPDRILPPCYQQQHYRTLQQQLHKLTIHTGEAVDYLLSPAGKEITKASLSNIFEYTSEAEFRKVCRQLHADGDRSLQFIFWNLLQDQGIPVEQDNWETTQIFACVPQAEACFYFRNVRVLSFNRVIAPASVPVSFVQINQAQAMIQSEYFSSAFLEKIMRQHAPGKNIRVKEVQPLDVDNSASILVALTSGRTEKLVGHFGLAVTYETNGSLQTRNMVMKLKPHGTAIVEMLNALAAACGGELPAVYEKYKTLTGFQHTHQRELEIYGKTPPGLTPQIYGLYADPAAETYIILMEYLQEVELLNSVMAPEKWTDLHIRQALKQIAAWHAAHLEKSADAKPNLPLGSPTAAFMQSLKPLWEKLLQNAALKFPDLYTPARVLVLEAAILQIPQYWQELAAMPKTWVHNDLNPRNTCFRNLGGELRLCVYDWELATFHVPQYDIVEFLSFVLDADRYHLRPEYLAFYRQQLQELTGQFPDPGTFQRGFALAALDFGLHRLGMYMMAHAVVPYPFLPRVVNSYFNTLEQFGSTPAIVYDTAHTAPLRTASHW